MIHARRKIVNTIAALISATDICRHVTTRQHERPDMQDLPYCLVIATSEENEAITLGHFLDATGARVLSRALLVEVTLMAASLDGVDDELDKISASIEIALAAPKQLGLADLVRGHLIRAVNFERGDVGTEAPLATLKMDVLVTYLVPDNNPLVEE